MDLRWPDLTTPREAFRLAQGHSADLPHDLWPASDLRDISPRLAQQLITGQFLSQAELSAVGAAFPRSYRFPGSQELLPSLRQLDPNLEAGLRSGQLQLTGSLAVHQLYCAKILSVPSEDASQAMDTSPAGNALERLQTSERRFRFSASDTSAGAMIKALTANLGIECEFDPEANPQLEKIIPIKAEDQTIYEIVRLIADKASLKIQAAGDKLRVSAQQ